MMIRAERRSLFGCATRLLRVAGIAFCALAECSAFGQDTGFAPQGQQIPTPPCLQIQDAWRGPRVLCDAGSHAAWLKDISHWRSERLVRIGYNGERYGAPGLQWTQRSFMQPQLMVQDRFFFDPATSRYTVDRYLKDLEDRFGGIDAVLIWPTYPNMGVDDRNQLDMVRSMPGGVAGVRAMVDDFHRHKVKVLFPMMMWDQGTRDPGRPWPEAIAELMKEIGADGVNGDTQDGVPLAFSVAADRIGHPLVFEPEGSPHDEGVAWNLMTWGQYKFPFVPQVDRFKWLEPRHMVNISDRWNRSKTDDLQFAFFNGVGWESWENIWGIWNGITPRDGEATRRVATIERAVAPFLASAGWEPLFPMERYGVFASRWPGAGATVWTIVNRNEYDVSGEELSVAGEPGMRFFDLYHGVELTPGHRGGASVLSFDLEGHGYGAVLGTAGPLDASLRELMDRMRVLSAKPLASYSAENKILNQTMVAIAPAPRGAGASEGMVAIPGGKYLFQVEGIEIEGHDDNGVDVQYAWENSPRRFHSREREIAPFLIDTYPVTNKEFKRFLDATHYRPVDGYDFLRDWRDGAYPEGWGERPVTWVSLEDARAYAVWCGKRLPHEWEWQMAAQGNDGRRYPWGDAWRESAVPVVDQGRTLRGPDAVGRHPEGASPFGAMDMVGNVWQWTDEYVDAHTRFAIVRGGSYFQPQGSIWYFPQAYRNDQHGKLLLMAPGYDRSGTIGFRCVRDVR